MSNTSRILVGVIGRPHGVAGRVRVTSYTENPADLTAYGVLAGPGDRSFMLRWEGEGIAALTEVVDGVPAPVTDRTAAEGLTNTKLYIERDRLPPLADEEFYLADLVGLPAVEPDGAALGHVAGVHDYGAGPSLEIAREDGSPLLVPFTKACVPEIDLAAARVVVVPPVEIEASGEAAR